MIDGMTQLHPTFQVTDDEIDLLEFAAVVRHQWIWIASGGLLGLAITGISALMGPRGLSYAFGGVRIDSGPNLNYL